MATSFLECDVGFDFADRVGVFRGPTVGADGVRAGGVGVGGTVGAFAGGAAREEINSSSARTIAIRTTAAMTARSKPRRRLGRGLRCTGDPPCLDLDAPV